MSKLSPALKACIAASHAKPNTLPAPSNISSVYSSIWHDAQSKHVGLAPFLAIATGATMTMNSPDSLNQLYQLAAGTARSREQKPDPLWTAHIMREAALKCISFNGIPRTINMLNSFRAFLSSTSPSLINQLSTTPRRQPTERNLAEIQERGSGLWKSIYAPLDDKLLAKLGDAHPDLPVHILCSHYGPLLADFAGHEEAASSGEVPVPRVGRVLTSILAVACLRAQTGVGPQVISHVFGLRKAYEDGSALAEEEAEGEVQGGRWLAGDEGSVWLLERVDAIVEAISRGRGTSFAPGMASGGGGGGREKAKL
jgi:hypothetical protein